MRKKKGATFLVVMAVLCGMRKIEVHSLSMKKTNCFGVGTRGV